MAVLATIWVRGAGAQGLKDGTSLANAYGLDPNVADDAWTAINALPALTNNLEIKICGGGTIGASIIISRSVTTAYRVIVQGRNAGDTADEEVAIDAGGGAFTVISFNNCARYQVFDIRGTNTNAAAGKNGFYMAGASDNMVFTRCRGDNCDEGFYSSSGSFGHTYIDCRAHDNVNYGWDIWSTRDRCIRCVSHDNGWGFSNAEHYGCVSYGHTNTGFDYHIVAVGCIAYNNGTDGFYNLATGANCTMIDCLSVNNGRFGFNQPTAHTTLLLRCGTILNTSGRTNSAIGAWNDLNNPALTADPFINAAAANFALNNAAGGGRLCRNNAGLLVPGGLSRTYLDIGAIQTLRAPAVPQGLQSLTAGVIAS